MKGELILRSETGESVAAVYRVQESGRIAISEALLSLDIPKEELLERAVVRDFTSLTTPR